VTGDDGKLEKTTYKPPSDPSALQNQGEAQSLVTHSLMNAQKDANASKNRPSADIYATSFQNTDVIAKVNDDGDMSFKP
jgi:hypothetical protein